MAAPRRINLHSVLAPDQLMLKDATIREELGRLSVMDLDLLSPNESLALDDLLGRGFSVELVLDGDKSRFFHGIVAECSQTGRLGRYARYSAKIVPWLWFLTRTSDCRIFQNKSVPDIIKSVFREHGTSDFEDSCGSYSPRDYCVQYMETDFDFVSRLMEEEGIYYFFKHTQDKDTLVLCDSAGAHSATPGCESVPYYPPSDNVVREEDYIDHWQLSHSMQSGKLTHTDFDFIKPRTSLLAKADAAGTYPKGDAEVFAYPGGYLTVGDGGKYAQRRLEALQQQHEHAVGSGNVRALAVGALFTLENYPRDDQNREYLVVSSVHHFGGTDYESGVAHGSADVTVSFDVIPSKQPYRSLLTTRRARVAGPQTAIVVGKAGEEIYTDQYGRVKVQFHWDRVGNRDENSSCWVRVSQAWAGKNWGSIHIPRIGQEVIVDFLEGDPDRPIITGRVYNAAEMPPYDLPANQTQSGIKSRSSKGGAPANFNEIRFEDKMGSEMLTIHAEKDKEVIVEHDETRTVGHDQMESVGHDRTRKVGNDETILIQRDRTMTIDRDKTETVLRNKTMQIVNNHSENIGGAMSIVVGKTLTESVLINYAESVGGAMELTVGAALAITVGAAMSEAVAGAKSEVIGGSKTESTGASKTLQVGTDLTETISKNRSVTIGKDLTEKIDGQHSVQVTKESILTAKKVEITADDEISLKTGDASIVMKSNGDVTISGGKITVKASGDLILKGSKIAEN
ncbi:MAG TPA: type VI secretion system tip protein TssI/VgrG [Steroidobacteraceae bacterium]|nr:type VI secretion system tip protein TssI/VgrG [Steroidobacteraceae bacterium]